MIYLTIFTTMILGAPWFIGLCSHMSRTGLPTLRELREQNYVAINWVGHWVVLLTLLSWLAALLVCTPFVFVVGGWDALREFWLEAIDDFPRFLRGLRHPGKVQ